MQRITRKTAQELGLKSYSPPNPCERHPGSDRYTSSGKCRLCHLERNELKYAIKAAKIEDSEPYCTRLVSVDSTIKYAKWRT